MNADVKGALAQINHSYKAFKHRGKNMTKKQVKAVLEFAVSQEYKTTDEISFIEIDTILENLQNQSNY